MPKRRRAKHPEILNRTVSVVTYGARLRVAVDEPREPEPEIEVKPWLEVRGLLDSPVRQTSDLTLSVYPDARTKVGTARPAAVGAIGPRVSFSLFRSCTFFKRIARPFQGVRNHALV